MAGVFQDIEATGQERRHHRIRLAKGFTVALIVATVFVFRDVGTFLVAVYAVVLPIFFVLDGWLGLAAREAPMGFLHYLRSRAVEFVVLLGAFAAGLLWQRPDSIKWNAVALLLAAAIVTLARAVYSWRERYRQTNYGLAGDASAFTVLSRPAIRIHFAGYAIGLAAALAATALAGDWLMTGAAYFAAFIAGKCAVDSIWPLPASLAVGLPSRTLAKMTALSPLLWGLPWGIAIGGYFFLWNLSLQPQHLAWSLLQAAWVGLSIAVAVSLVFALLTAIAYGHEFFAGAKAEPDDNDGADSRYWTVHYWAVLCLALAGLGVMIEPMAPRVEEIFGEETWTCAKRSDEYELVWIGKSGVRISVRRHYVDLFNISCVPRADGNGCAYDDEGWHEITIAITQDGRSLTPITFGRASPGVRSDFRHHADIYGDLADAIVGAFRTGQSAKLTIRAKNGRLLYEKTIDLRGFLEGQNSCQARWG